MALVPEEILATVLKYGSAREFSAESHAIQRTVFRMRKNPKYFDVLKVFRFSGSPVAPHSEVLENALFNMQFSNKLTRLNPDMVTYNLTEDLDKYYNTHVEGKLSADPCLRSLMQDLAKDIEATLGAEH